MSTVTTFKVFWGEQCSWKHREQVLASGDGDEEQNSSTC